MIYQNKTVILVKKIILKLFMKLNISFVCVIFIFIVNEVVSDG